MTAGETKSVSPAVALSGIAVEGAPFGAPVALTSTLRPASLPRLAGGCSSAGRALQSHCRGQGFDPPQLHMYVLPRGVTGNTPHSG